MDRPLACRTDEELARFVARQHEYPSVEVRPRLTRYYDFLTNR